MAEPEVERELREQRPDLGVVVAFGQFVPRRIRELPALGYCINGHASLLPRWRGAAPVAHAILAGDAVTGVSVMRVEREMDAGPVALQREIPIRPEENAGELAARLAGLGAELVDQVIEAIAPTRAWIGTSPPRRWCGGCGPWPRHPAPSPPSTARRCASWRRAPTPAPPPPRREP
jgi:methionyl-tRNA formyltransferase